MKYRSRKFLLAAFFTLAGTAALYLGKLSGGEWISLAGLIVGLYGASDVADQKLNGKP